MTRNIQNGDHVKYVDTFGVEHDALVKQCWGTKDYEDGRAPAINVVFVTKDASKTDAGGQQTEYETSVSHKSMTTAPGRYWFQP
jgi:hypothetical protein